MRGLAPSTRAALVERLGEEARVCGLPGREVLQAWVGAEQAAAPETLDLKVSKISHMRHRFESRATDAAS